MIPSPARVLAEVRGSVVVAETMETMETTEATETTEKRRILWREEE
jgi:hypothetical protein